jgi:hypothetical protein
LGGRTKPFDSTKQLVAMSIMMKGIMMECDAQMCVFA